MIAAELTDWLRSQRIKDTLSYDRIIGCPHEEGVDYPLGRSCPYCPFCEYSRGVAVSALALLAVWGEVPRDAILDYFVWLAREGLEREKSYVWGALAAESADIEALAVFPDLRRAARSGPASERSCGPLGGCRP